MKIINIIDSISKVNFGIWNSAVSTAGVLKTKYNVDSELWFPANTGLIPDADQLNGCLAREIGSFDIGKSIDSNTIIVSHGCWQLPTRLAWKIKKKFGIPWVYVPHGMLEPWSMNQKRVLKTIYFNLIEKRNTLNAHAVRAVGSPEFNNLKSTYKKLFLIPNGIQAEKLDITKRPNKIQFLFLARLHSKKGILPLVNAWISSLLNNSDRFCLTIAGPDDGELAELEKQIGESQNIKYIGAVYGQEKEQLLSDSHFYVLPSFSEGFPTSVLEAMNYGAIPLISHECNFPEAFSSGLAMHLSPRIEHIISALEKASEISQAEREALSARCSQFIADNYSIDKIADMQMELYRSILKK
jgi:glycosyltransferase involved in cell wall biosynthesis